MTAKRLIATIAFIAALGTGGLFAGRLLLGSDSGGTEARDPSIIEQLDDIKAREAQAKSEGRFMGELLGIYIAPSMEQLPRQVLEEDERARAGGCEVMPAEKASALDFARPL